MFRNVYEVWEHQSDWDIIYEYVLWSYMFESINNNLTNAYLKLENKEQIAQQQQTIVPKKLCMIHWRHRRNKMKVIQLFHKIVPFVYDYRDRKTIHTQRNPMHETIHSCSLAVNYLKLSVCVKGAGKLLRRALNRIGAKASSAWIQRSALPDISCDTITIFYGMKCMTMEKCVAFSLFQVELSLGHEKPLRFVQIWQMCIGQFRFHSFTCWGNQIHTLTDARTHAIPWRKYTEDIFNSIQLWNFLKWRQIDV